MCRTMAGLDCGPEISRWRTSKSTENGSNHDDSHGEMQDQMYLRFAAMILTAMVVMYAVMFVSSWEWSRRRLLCLEGDDTCG